LGATRDYLVAAADGTSLRVVTAPTNLVAEGSEVWLTLPAERCRALAR
jgi:iron(III) transport system ATP-binding protein